MRRAIGSTDGKAEQDVQLSIARYLAQCFVRGRSPHVGELAAQLGSNTLALSRRFQRATGQTLGSFFHEQQIIRARRLLRWPDMPVPDVARAAGFERLRTFYRSFRRVAGTTPRRFRAAQAVASNAARARG
jgi:AraC family transcriptional activator of pobA